MYWGIQGVLNFTPIMPRDTSLSDSYTSDRCYFFSPERLWPMAHLANPTIVLSPSQYILIILFRLAAISSQTFMQMRLYCLYSVEWETVWDNFGVWKTTKNNKTNKLYLGLESRYHIKRCQQTHFQKYILHVLRHRAVPFGDSSLRKFLQVKRYVKCLLLAHIF